MKFMRRHMWIGGALLLLAAVGYAMYLVSYRFGFFMGSH